MNALVNAMAAINDQAVSIVEYKGVPVVTTAMLAEFYGTDDVRIQQNFLRNAEYFIDGKHQFKLEGDDLRDFKLTSSKIVSANTRNLILWTERGAMRHAKLLDTDTAWNVFEQLEDSYFGRKQSNAISLPDFTDPAAAAIAWAGEYKAKQQAIAERDHAIATKAQIGSKREATAMANTATANRKLKALENQLDQARDYASVKKVESITKRKFEWKPLKHWSVKHGVEIKKAFDANYEKGVNTYSSSAWLAVYGVDIYALECAK